MSDENGRSVPSAPVAPEPDERLTAGRFTVSTDPDGRSYLFGKNDPEPYDGFISGGVELFAWEPEAVDALRVALAAAPELETLRDRIQQRITHAQRRLNERDEDCRSCWRAEWGGERMPTFSCPECGRVNCPKADAHVNRCPVSSGSTEA